ncbi:MAG: Co2+/Mg2+ efflux protein ApaG [Proteobacteria bacterium]|nr:Co2+/Mg2+ efflux protein ApaG [Pseudomonadota bacterium]
MSRGPPRDVYVARTRDIVVRAQPVYQAAQSDPSRNQFTWSYTMEIENHGAETVQLVSRHWIITDAQNRVEEVKGPGVVGEQPTLKPREAYRYTSACPLTTSSGAMRGSYQMVTEGGEIFEAEIPEFSLHRPEAVKRMN